jgi:hypothetical protein
VDHPTLIPPQAPRLHATPLSCLRRERGAKGGEGLKTASASRRTARRWQHRRRYGT